MRGLVVGAFGGRGVGGRPLAPHDSRGLWFWFVAALARRDGARARRISLAAHRAAPHLLRHVVWGVHFALRTSRASTLNARLKLARVHSAQGRGLPTAAGRGRSHTAVRARADTDSNFHGQFGYRSAAHITSHQRPLRSAAECEERRDFARPSASTLNYIYSPLCLAARRKRPSSVSKRRLSSSWQLLVFYLAVHVQAQARAAVSRYLTVRPPQPRRRTGRAPY